MPDLYNLGDLIAPSHDLDHLALIDLGGEQAPRQVDIPVKRVVGESYTGRDAQLDTAVRELLKQIGGR